MRYFNEADWADAMKVLDAFKQKYPDAVLVPLKIPAPAGQSEVWLPRVQAPGRVLQRGRLGMESRRPRLPAPAPRQNLRL